VRDLTIIDTAAVSMYEKAYEVLATEELGILYFLSVLRSEDLKKLFTVQFHPAPQPHLTFVGGPQSQIYFPEPEIFILGGSCSIFDCTYSQAPLIFN